MRRLSERARAHTLLGSRIPMASLIQTRAVAHHLSFRQAAISLGLSQSSVSERVRTLEEDLGIRLFERHTRGVRLTEAGRHFVSKVDDAIDIIDRAVKTAGMHARGEQGILRIGVYALVSGGFLSLLLERFRSLYSEIDLRITEGSARDAQIQVREDQLDVAFMACNHEIHDLHSRVFWHDRVMVALSEYHPLAKRQHVDWKDLAEETFLVRESGTGPQVHDLIVVRSAGLWPVPTILRYDVGRDSLLSMIASDHGISLFVAENAAVAPRKVSFVPIRDEYEAVAFSAVWSPYNRSAVLRNLLVLGTEMG